MATGLTIDELRAKMDEALAKYYQNPRTIITPVAFHSKKYFMLGAVANKGVYTFDRPLKCHRSHRARRRAGNRVVCGADGRAGGLAAKLSGAQRPAGAGGFRATVSARRPVAEHSAAAGRLPVLCAGERERDLRAGRSDDARRAGIRRQTQRHQRHCRSGVASLREPSRAACWWCAAHWIIRKPSWWIRRPFSRARRRTSNCSPATLFTWAGTLG